SVHLRHLQLLCNVKTQWDSVFYMIRRLHELRQAIDYFLLMQANKDLADYKLNDAEWTALQDFEIILLVFQQLMSQECTPVLAGAIPAFEMFMASQEKLGTMNPHL
ncbi:hypothetical protein BDN71DRAFT_1364148, partial [Pleurotus eryngii]